MRTTPSPAISSAVALLIAVVFPPATFVDGLGSGATIAVSYGSRTVCGIVAGEANQRIECYQGGRVFPVEPNASFSAITAGQGAFCGLRSGGYSMICWNIVFSPGITFRRKRIYLNGSFPLESIAAGDDQVCGIVNGTGSVHCWRGVSPDPALKFRSISSGSGFSCGILRNSRRVHCWGSNEMGREIQEQFANQTMASIVAGVGHACGMNELGFIICRGSNRSGQLDAPSGAAMEFSGLALGASHSCAVRQPTGYVVCWGGGEDYSPSNVSFVSIVSGSNFTCGLTTRNFSIICWGPGWPRTNGSGDGVDLPLPTVLPGPCVQSSCSDCGIYPQSESLCSGSESICKPCLFPNPTAPAPVPAPAPIPPSSSKSLSRGLLAFAVVGSVGCVAGICTLGYCLWAGVCCGHKKIHNSVQPTNTAVSNSSRTSGSTHSPPSRCSTIRRQSSRIMRRQRSGPSSNKNADRAEQFSLAELAAAADGFSPENRIGAGSFGVVYRGKLGDGREVAIKRGETGARKKMKFQEKEMAFESEISFLSRLHHKHLVRLVGYCEEMDERLLVYEYMKNGALYNHLHDRGDVEKDSSFLNSWKARIKISLDAARGIEYLHSYAVPPVIHRDIKSSNILLDANWTARVSDFGLSLMSPVSDPDQSRPLKAVGTMGYIDPEYYGLKMVTAKSDVYGFGVVLLELLTGKKAIFREGGETGEAPVSIVDYAVPAIRSGEWERVVDARVGRAELNEAEAVELVANTAMQCVSLEGRERPTITDIVATLERAVGLCEENSHGSISGGSIVAASE